MTEEWDLELTSPSENTRNTSTSGMIDTEHLLNADRRHQTSKNAIKPPNRQGRIMGKRKEKNKRKKRKKEREKGIGVGPRKKEQQPVWRRQNGRVTCTEGQQHCPTLPSLVPQCGWGLGT